MGEVESGAFDKIVWSSGNYFLKVGVDPEGGDDYIDHGTSQLLSVPYSLHSGSVGAMVVMSTAQRDSIDNPIDGMLIYNTDINKIQIWNGQHWTAQNVTFSCVPKPNAGLDQNLFPGDTAILNGNIPDYGTGTWSIINGTGGEILDSTNHHSTF
ncbi:MAG: hypothetical protein PHD61_10370 [Bacteroidales bacterium]|nr:hypothetical protein [Lentimicrobiaceae bacterium]MDD5695690.1 hypothetical protein [Bacteroidales bacterium]